MRRRGTRRSDRNARKGSDNADAAAMARQKRRAMTGMRQFADGVVHNDGLSGLSSCGFAREAH